MRDDRVPVPTVRSWPSSTAELIDRRHRVNGTKGQLGGTNRGTRPVTGKETDPMNMRKRFALSVAAVAVGSGLAFAPTASAAPQSAAAAGCAYPYVCFYKGSAKTGQFKDVTSGWQSLGSSKGATKMVNTRHDDIVYTHFTNGKTHCTPPGYVTTFGSWVVDKVRISSASSC
ncbi:hypothetical protein GCM10010424_54550 [Streptomyces lienomycini]